MKLKNIIINIITIVLTILILFVLTMTVTGCKGYAVVTDSMSPEINRGDAVFVKKTEYSEIAVGDIVTVFFKDGSGTFTHRVVEINKDKNEFYTQGDNSQTKDGVSKSEQLVGKVWFTIPLAGYISIYVKSKKTAAVILLSVVLISIIIGAVTAKTKNVRGDNDEQ